MLVLLLASFWALQRHRWLLALLLLVLAAHVKLTALTLVPGTNVFLAYALDLAGNRSATNSVSFFYSVTNQLRIQATGQGTLSPNYSNAWLEIGRRYTNTATGINGYAFTNWVLSTNWVGGLISNSATLQFIMQSNLTLQVNFGTNRFFDAMGTYYGLFSHTGGVTFSNAGLLTVKVKAKDLSASRVLTAENGLVPDPHLLCRPDREPVVPLGVGAELRGDLGGEVGLGLPGPGRLPAAAAPCRSRAAR